MQVTAFSLISTKIFFFILIFDESWPTEPLILQENEEKTVSCEGSFVIVSRNSDKSITITCSKSNFPQTSEISQTNGLSSYSRENSQYKCNGDDTKLIEINENDESFERIILLCFNLKLKYTLWTLHTLENPNESEDSDINLDFESDFMGKSKAKIAEIYENANKDDRTGRKSEIRTLYKGQLVPYSDFNSSQRQALTFYYINTAPMLGELRRPWKILESSIRKKIFLSDPWKRVEIYTGTFIDQNNYSIIRNLDENQSAMRVPDLFWKIVICEKVKKAVAFLGLNRNGGRKFHKKLLNNLEGSKDDECLLNLFNGTDQVENYVFCYSIGKFVETVKKIVNLEKEMPPIENFLEYEVLQFG